MKKLALLAAFAALTACGQHDEANNATDNVANDMATEAAAETAPDGGPVAGTYSLRDMDGNETGTTTINADMSYSYASADGSETESGTFSLKDGVPCFDPEGDAEEHCHPGGGDAAPDGSWPSHDTEGNVTGTVIRVTS